MAAAKKTTKAKTTKAKTTKAKTTTKGKVKASTKPKKPVEVDVKKDLDSLVEGDPDHAAILEAQMEALKEGALVENPKQNDQDKAPAHTSVVMSPKYDDVKTNPFYYMTHHQQQMFAKNIGVGRWQTLRGTALIAAIKKKVVADKLDLFKEATKAAGGKLEGEAHKLQKGESITNPDNKVMSHAIVDESEGSK